VCFAPARRAGAKHTGIKGCGGKSARRGEASAKRVESF
jgi:hypothetical protein